MMFKPKFKFYKYIKNTYIIFGTIIVFEVSLKFTKKETYLNPKRKRKKERLI
jgi:hypothetical protein